MLTAILILVILSALLSSLAALLAAGALGWAKAAHDNTDFLLTQVLKAQGEHTDLLENHSESLDRIDENLLVVNDTANALEQLLTASEKVLEQNTLVALDTFAAVKSAKECLGAA